MKMQLAEIANALGLEAQPEYDQVTVTSVSFDSRKLKEGALFVPLMGNTGTSILIPPGRMAP